MKLHTSARGVLSGPSRLRFLWYMLQESPKHKISALLSPNKKQFVDKIDKIRLCANLVLRASAGGCCGWSHLGGR